MPLSTSDLQAIWLTVRLATATTLLLLLIGMPLAWWLARTHSRWRAPVSAVVALPLVLPPTVLGFYLLVVFGPQGWGGQLTQSLGLGLLPFTFGGLLLGSVLYSLPFAVQPLQTAFEAVGRRPLEAAAMLRAGPLDSFFHVVLPLARGGIVQAAVLSFAHTVGEFGVVLMIGGNIPHETKVLSIAIYDFVERGEWLKAHWVSGGMVLFAFVVVTATMLLDRRFGRLTG